MPHNTNFTNNLATFVLEYRGLPGKCEHAEQCCVQIAGVVVALDASVLATQGLHVARTTADRLHSPWNRGTVHASKL